ncbi:MAG: hypothetical protein WAP35_10330 [Solirubrobacterales bacterium]
MFGARKKHWRIAGTGCLALLAAVSLTSISSAGPTFGCSRDLTQQQMLERARDIRAEFGLNPLDDRRLVELDGKRPDCSVGTALTRAEVRWIDRQEEIASREIDPIHKYIRQYRLQDSSSLALSWTRRGTRLLVKLMTNRARHARGLRRVMRRPGRLVIKPKRFHNRYINLVGNKVDKAWPEIEARFGPIYAQTTSEEDEEIVLSVELPTVELNVYLRENFGPLVRAQQGTPVVGLEAYGRRDKGLARARGGS